MGFSLQKAEESVLGGDGVPEIGKVAPFFYNPETRVIIRLASIRARPIL